MMNTKIIKKDLRPGTTMPDDSILETQFSSRAERWEPRPEKKENFHKLILVSDASGKKEYPLDRSDITAGRSRNCAIRIADSTVSGHHMLISVRGGQCFLKDLNSRNGTFVNSQPVYGASELKSGDEIRAGDARFVFVPKEDDAPEVMAAGRAGKKNIGIKLVFYPFFTILCFMLLFTGVSLPPRAMDTVHPAGGAADQSEAAEAPETPEAPPVKSVAMFNADGLIDVMSRITTSSPKKSEKPGNERGSKDKKSTIERIEDAVSLYSKGRVKEALTGLRGLSAHAKKSGKSRIRKLTEKMQKASRLFDSGLSHYKNKHFTQAFRVWKRVIHYEKEIIQNDKGYYSVRIAGYIGDEYYRKARLFYDKKERTKAAKYCEIALSACPGHRRALELNQLISKAGKG